MDNAFTRSWQVLLLGGASATGKCEELGVPALPARSWDTLFDRVLDAIR